MNYFTGRKLGKLCEQLILYSAEMTKLEDEESLTEIQNKCVVFEVNEKKKKKYQGYLRGKYIEELYNLLEKVKRINSKVECNMLGKELSILIYDMRKEIPLACQGNLVGNKFYLTCVEMVAITVFGFISFLR